MSDTSYKSYFSNAIQRHHIHFIGICGVAMAPIAKMFKDMGWKVTGSDKGFFPPVSEYLRANKIEFWAGWHPERLTPSPNLSLLRERDISSPPNKGEGGREGVGGSPDLVVVGNFIGMNNPEFAFIREQGIPYKSYPEIVAEYIIKLNSIVVTGTYGKTTISACLAWILEQAGYNPSYLCGGLLLNFPDGARATDSTWSVVEGDEYSTSRWDPQPKFGHYKPKYLVVTSTTWDHTDIYKTNEEYLETFKRLTVSVPHDGLLIYSRSAVSPRVLEGVRCKVADYLDKADTSYVSYRTTLIGSHNIQNLSAAAILAQEIGINDAIIQKSLSSFKGVRRRLEIRADINGVTIIDDLAHSPHKARASIAAVREAYPKGRIRVVFEPNIGSRTKEALPLFRGAFDQADEVYIPKLSSAKKDSSQPEWVSGGELVEYIKSEIRNPKSETSLEIRNSKFEINYIENDENLTKRLVHEAKPGDVIVFMGSHGFRGMIEETIKRIQGHK